ncbi:glucose-6-phosphate isomerase [Calothrix sp. 336/3]|uniref:glucose-6-phosphate isomerase n=1 Tax=Calothrix sp. 336/3 TaxID=1337936 RepID=UPI0004E4660B|nr:glucose-6-phosphate isomerase [Calothrix sp. 336/3]AKG23263.1 glucose-6-phosphate isomerase [Calothrix sp. 336/3]
MIDRQVLPAQSSQNNVIIEKQPILAWLAIMGLVLFSTVCIAGGLGSIFRPGYVLITFLIAIFLYIRYPLMYTGFCFWLWFITPFLSRLIDSRSTFDESRFILISQYLANLITLYPTLMNLPKIPRLGGLPFVLALLGIFYGFLVGFIKTSAFTAARGMLDWLTPISFSCYLLLNWRYYPQYRDTLQRVFVWAVFVTGAYGIYQYLVAPEWDRFWLISTKLGAFGRPEPMQIRVWSTMASPGPFSTMLTAGLLLLFTNAKTAIKVPAAMVGYLSFLLTLVRTMWGCWLIGLMMLLSSLKQHIQMRLIVTVVALGICVIPLTTIEPFSDVIGKRLQTFTNLEDDSSATARQDIYADGLSKALSNYLGNGVGNTFTVNEKGILVPIVIDSGFLDTFFTLGWFGAIFYLSALMTLLYTVFQFSEVKIDTFLAGARAIGVACVASIPISSVMLGFQGILLWGFLTMVLVGHKYYKHQQNHPQI